MSLSNGNELQSDGFCLLAATLLNVLPSSGQVPDALLMQLHAIFGPMLLSALQLIDRREVVLVNLPGRRTIYQVTSSTGQPYTLYTSLPPLIPLSDGRSLAAVESARSPSPTPALLGPTDDTSALPPPTNADDIGFMDAHTSRRDQLEQTKHQHDRDNDNRIRALAAGIERMYCPCAGFLFNSLGGDRNYLCKHLLSILIAHHTEKMVRTEVYLPGVVELLGLGKRVQDAAVPVSVAG